MRHPGPLPLVCAALALASACFSPRLGAEVACGPGGECPAGRSCDADGVCRAEPLADAAPPAGDAGAPDGGVAPLAFEARPIALADGPFAVALADLDGDQRLDALATHATAAVGQPDLTVLLGDGQGGLAFAAPIVLAETGAVAVAVGDLNGDALVDLAVACFDSGGVATLFGDGGGGFAKSGLFGDAPGTSAVAIGELDGSPPVDLVQVNALTDSAQLVLGLGAQTLGLAVGLQPESVLVADLDGAPEADVACANIQSGSVSTSTLARGFAIDEHVAGGAPVALAAGDLDGDLLVDLVVANGEAPGSVGVLRNAGGLAFDGPALFQAGNQPRGLVVVDVDGDGALDVASANTGSGDVTVLLNDGAGALALAATIPVGAIDQGPVQQLAAGDVDGDGRADLLVALLAERSLVLLLQR